MPNDERILETMPDGALGLIPLKSCEYFSKCRCRMKTERDMGNQLKQIQ